MDEIEAMMAELGRRHGIEGMRAIRHPDARFRKRHDDPVRGRPLRALRLYYADGMGERRNACRIWARIEQ